MPKAWLAAYSKGTNWGPALEPVNEGKRGPSWQQQVFEYGTGTYARSKVSWQPVSKGTTEPWLYNASHWLPIGHAVSSVGTDLRRDRTAAVAGFLTSRVYTRVQNSCIQNVFGYSRQPTSFSYEIRMWSSNLSRVDAVLGGSGWRVTDGLNLTHTESWRINAINRHRRKPVVCRAWSPPANAFPGTFAVGDSVMVDAQANLEHMGITVNAAVSRQFDTGIAILKQDLQNGTLPPRVVIGLGTNGPMTQTDFDAALTMLKGEKRVVVLTVREPRWWEAQVNQVIWNGVKTVKNARVGDWYSASAGHDEYFAGDGIHLNTTGALAYAHVVANALGAP